MLRVFNILVIVYGVSSIFTFIRGVYVAKVLGASEYGLAVFVLSIFSFFQIVTDFGVTKKIVQSNNNEASDFVEVSHLFEIVRGAMIALLLFILLPTIIGESISGGFTNDIYIVSVVPLILGFKNLFYVKAMKAGNYKPLLIVEVIPKGSALVGTFIASIWFDTILIVIIALVVQSVLECAFTHLVSRDSYRINYNKFFAIEVVKFGFPIMLSGIFTYLVLHGEKTIIGLFLNMNDLGEYALAFSLCLMPVLVLSNIFEKLLLPRLSGSSTEFELFSRMAIFLHLLCSVLLVVIFYFLVSPVVELFFGEGFKRSVEYIGPISLAFGLKLFRTSYVLILLSKGKTKDCLVADILRASVYIPVSIGLYLGGELSVVILGNVIGELIALLYHMYLTNRIVNIFGLKAIERNRKFLVYLKDLCRNRFKARGEL